MPTAAFSAALPFVLRWEGGFVNNHNDPGGATNRGVTHAVYNAWRTRQGQPSRDVRDIADDEVHSIYGADYWVPPRCDLLRHQLDLVQFDTAVNMGPGRAVRLLQGTLGCEVDSATSAAARAGLRMPVISATPSPVIVTAARHTTGIWRQRTQSSRCSSAAG